MATDQLELHFSQSDTKLVDTDPIKYAIQMKLARLQELHGSLVVQKGSGVDPDFHRFVSGLQLNLSLDEHDVNDASHLELIDEMVRACSAMTLGVRVALLTVRDGDEFTSRQALVFSNLAI